MPIRTLTLVPIGFNWNYPANSKKSRCDMTDRIAELEMRIADHEKTISEMSDVIAAQWKEIDGLTGKLDRLAKRFAALEDLSAPDVPVTRPPHW